tara:strand:+ start:351 stop:482 length:132 start_codon:yes stop_codon:yes gene_type:complete
MFLFLKFFSSCINIVEKFNEELYPAAALPPYIAILKYESGLNG